jgi:hypothetical protein
MNQVIPKFMKGPEVWKPLPHLLLTNQNKQINLYCRV